MAERLGENEVSARLEGFEADGAKAMLERQGLREKMREELVQQSLNFQTV